MEQYMKTKVMLIKSSIEIRGEYESPEIWFPDGLLHIATILRKNDIDTQIIDFNNAKFVSKHKVPIRTGKFTAQTGIGSNIIHDCIEKNLENVIYDYKPDIIGIGCFSSEAFTNLKIIAKKIKDISSEIPVVIGGIHPTLFAGEILRKYSFIDYVVIGEGDITFLELVKGITNNSNSLSSIDGIAFRIGGDVKQNPKTKFIENLDSLPFVDYSSINLKDYEINTSHWYSPKNILINRPFSILSSRSCPERCNFCSMHSSNGPRVRSRSPSHVVDEIQFLYDNYGANYFHFTDDNMTFDKKRTLGICEEIIKRNLNIQFDTPNGLAIKRLDQEVIDALVDAGLVRVSLAIESGSEFIRNHVIGKNLKTEKICEVVENCAKHDHLYIKLFFIVGMPEETHETLEETFEMIKKLPHDFPSIHFATPYPGTKLFGYCKKNGLLPHRADSYMDFDEFHHDPEIPHIKPHNLTKDDLIKFRDKCYDYFYQKKDAANRPYNIPLRYKGYVKNR